MFKIRKSWWLKFFQRRNSSSLISGEEGKSRCNYGYCVLTSCNCTSDRVDSIPQWNEQVWLIRHVVLKCSLSEFKIESASKLQRCDSDTGRVSIICWKTNIETSASKTWCNFIVIKVMMRQFTQEERQTLQKKNLWINRKQIILLNARINEEEVPE